MSSCQVCDHAKVEAIHAALDRGRLPGVVAVQFRLDKPALINHLQICRAPVACVFEPENALARPHAMEREALPLMNRGVTDNPMGQFKEHLGPLAEAYHRTDDLTMRDRMRFLLNEALQSEDMGL